MVNGGPMTYGSSLSISPHAFSWACLILSCISPFILRSPILLPAISPALIMAETIAATQTTMSSMMYSFSSLNTVVLTSMYSPDPGVDNSFPPE